MGNEKADLIIRGAAEVITCADPADRFEVIDNGWVAVRGEQICAVGSGEQVEPLLDPVRTKIIDASRGVVAPGFVDCHTHLIFGGSRVKEYAARLTCNDPLELKKRGIKTGIHATIDDTRRASGEELYKTALLRLDRMLAAGSTTVESKSGYGLSMEAEIKMLEVNVRLANSSHVELVSTFLGAHGWPTDLSRERYIEVLLDEMIPWVADLGLARFCDVWCDDGYYSAQEAEKILIAGLDFGLEPKIHTDAYSYVGGSDLAASMGMVSADHLNYTPREAMKKLALSGVVGVLLPALDFAVRHQRPFNYAEMKEQGLTVALATNLCPGCWTESMQFVMALACRLYAMSPEEAILAATLGGAKALGLQDSHGSLEYGKLADIQIWDVPGYEHVIYRLGSNVVGKVIKKGRLVFEQSPSESRAPNCPGGEAD